MFGYIRPLVSEMRVCENELYRALYCGLCRAMGRHTGCASRLTLSYDFVFLCALRAALTETHFSIERHRCAVHPIKSRAMAADNDVFAYAAHAAAILNCAKVADDIADESGKKRMAAKLLAPSAIAIRRRVNGKESLEAAVNKHLKKLTELERENTASLDETASVFGNLLGDIFSYGLCDKNARIAREIGISVGRFIYVIDAADDAAEDAHTHSYNPILSLYADREGAPASLLTEASVTDRAGHTTRKMRLSPALAESICIAALNDLSRLEKAVDLIDFSNCQSETVGIIKNIVFLGMPAELRRVLALKSTASQEATI